MTHFSICRLSLKSFLGGEKGIQFILINLFFSLLLKMVYSSIFHVSESLSWCQRSNFAVPLKIYYQKTLCWYHYHCLLSLKDCLWWEYSTTAMAPQSFPSFFTAELNHHWWNQRDISSDNFGLLLSMILSWKIKM